LPGVLVYASIESIQFSPLWVDGSRSNAGHCYLWPWAYLPNFTARFISCLDLARCPSEKCLPRPWLVPLVLIAFLIVRLVFALPWGWRLCHTDRVRKAAFHRVILEAY
jgi:hypothetical protein